MTCQIFSIWCIAYPSIRKTIGMLYQPTPKALLWIEKEHAPGECKVCKWHAFADILQMEFPRGVFRFKLYQGICNVNMSNMAEKFHFPHPPKKKNNTKHDCFYKVGLAQNRHWFWFATQFLLIPWLESTTLEMIPPTTIKPPSKDSNETKCL